MGEALIGLRLHWRRGLVLGVLLAFAVAAGALAISFYAHAGRWAWPLLEQRLVPVSPRCGIAVAGPRTPPPASVLGLPPAQSGISLCLIQGLIRA